MRCNECQYPLWNLRTRICPECGKQFAPSNYQFIPNSVRFCCPHCDQEYYGTNERGQLVPPAFECVTCRTPISMDEMVLRPVRGEEDKTYAVIEAVPWLQRRKASWFLCWWKTIWRGMVAPTQMMRGLPHDAPAGDAWLFAFITLALSLIAGVGLPFGAIAVFDAASGGGDTLEILAVAVLFPIGSLLVTFLYLAIWGATTHWTLRLTGRSEHSMSGTFQTLCYSVGPNIFLAVPCLGIYCLGYVSSIWWIVSAILMLMTYQNVSGGRATLAVLVWPVITLIILGVLYFGLIFGGMFMGGFGPNAFAMQQQQIAMAQAEAQTMATGLRNYALINNKWPEHAVQLIDNQSIFPSSFFDAMTLSYTETTPLGDGTLEDYEYGDVRRQNQLIDLAVAAQPENVIAHRLGDYVFTYHGIDVNASDSRLWLFVIIEDPGINNQQYMVDPILVGTVGGFTTFFDRASFESELKKQNDYRAQSQLPPLPDDLLDLSHDSPATGP